ncbi:MAG: hypothetical protein GY711_16295 [bacterium]|nr:hypothetical protein [bacterium]
MKPTQELSSNRKNVAPPQPGAALVVARWNAWVRVWFPDTDETTWVNLEEVGCEILPAQRSDLGEQG